MHHRPFALVHFQWCQKDHLSSDLDARQNQAKSLIGMVWLPATFFYFLFFLKRSILRIKMIKIYLIEEMKINFYFFSEQLSTIPISSAIHFARFLKYFLFFVFVFLYGNKV